MATTTQAEKNEVHMLENQTTNDPDFIKPVPIIGKQDYSGAHEVCLPAHSSHIQIANVFE
jgi:hypothetical protein